MCILLAMPYIMISYYTDLNNIKLLCHFSDSDYVSFLYKHISYILCIKFPNLNHLSIAGGL